MQLHNNNPILFKANKQKILTQLLNSSEVRQTVLKKAIFCRSEKAYLHIACFCGHSAGPFLTSPASLYDVHDMDCSVEPEVKGQSE